MALMNAAQSGAATTDFVRFLESRTCAAEPFSAISTQLPFPPLPLRLLLRHRVDTWIPTYVSAASLSIQAADSWCDIASFERCLKTSVAAFTRSGSSMWIEPAMYSM